LDGKGRPLPHEYVLQPEDRVEIYRPLTIDPMQARLARAEEKRLAREAAKAKKK
jgi:putative ubiquitin-RnfH superfamily antitoxin RatB of RatAB toxin-antitoxin module